MTRLSLLLLLSTAPWAALAQDATVYVTPRIPSEAEKAEALKLAYKINGNSMVGWGSIDLSTSAPPAPREIPMSPAKK